MKCLRFKRINVVATTYIYHRENLGTRMTFFLLDISILLSEIFSSSFSPFYLFSLLYC